MFSKLAETALPVVLPSFVTGLPVPSAIPATTPYLIVFSAPRKALYASTAERFTVIACAIASFMSSGSVTPLAVKSAEFSISLPR